MMRDGIGGARDLEAAKFWLESAAADGHLPAYLLTTELFFEEIQDPQTGELVEFSSAKAYMWATATAERLGETPAGQSGADIRARLLELMPPDWQKSLDEKVEAHLATVRSQ